MHSLFGSCGTEPNGAACLDAHRNISNPYWIGDQPAGTEISAWLDAWTRAPSVCVIKARNAADVAAGVIFARENAASRHKLVRVFINKGLAGAPPEALAAGRRIWI